MNHEKETLMARRFCWFVLIAGLLGGFLGSPQSATAQKPQAKTQAAAAKYLCTKCHVGSAKAGKCPMCKAQMAKAGAFVCPT